MKNVLLVSLASLTMIVGGITSTDSINAKVEEKDAHIIVQLNQDTKGKTAKQVTNYQNYVLSYIEQNITSNFEVKNRYTNLLSAFTLEVPSAYVNQIRNLDQVKNVNYDQFRFKEESDGANYSFKKAANQDSENVSASTMNVPAQTNEGEGILIGILDTGYLIDYEKDGVTYTHEIYNELDNNVQLKVTQESLQSVITAQSFHGKPDATHSTYHNNKVPFYYDYGGKSDGKGAGECGYNVYNAKSDHGNHVASIAAGNAPTFKGIAPKAQLALLKVFTEYSTGTGAFDSAVLLGLEDAAALGCDIVNMSFGSDLNDFEQDSIVNEVIKTVTEQGMYCNVAAGNSGKTMYSLTGAYAHWSTDLTETGIISDQAANPSAVTVGAAQAKKEFYETGLVIDGHNISYKDQITKASNYSSDILLSGLSQGSETSLPWIFIPNYGESKDYEGKNATGKIVIVNRGETTFISKISQAVDHGAIAVGIINNDPSDTTFTFRMDLTGYTPTCPVFIILNRDKEIFETSTSEYVSLISNATLSNPTYGQMASFSSDGGLYDLRLKPEISAPGQSIKGGIYLDEDNANNYATDSYAYWDGTSMATPNYCGAVALLLADHIGDDDYFVSLNARTMSTADQLEDVYGVTASPRIQGAGMVNVGDALNSKTYLHATSDDRKAKIELLNNDDIKVGDVKLGFVGVNEDTTNVSYTATTYLYRPSIVHTTIKEDKASIFDNVDLQGTTNTLIKTATQTVVLNANSDTPVQLDTLSLTTDEKEYLDNHFENGCPLEGYVVLEAQGQVTLSIPFLGYYGDIQDADCVEPFSFEKEENKIYPSDVLNSIVALGASSNSSYASDIVTGYFKRETWSEESLESPLSDWISNESTIYGVKGDNGKYMSTIKNEKVGNDFTLYTSNNSTANTMIITQMVTRSVMTNTLTITKKSNQECILVDHMYDALYGAKEDDEGNEIAWPLRRSLIDYDFFESGYMASRAYTILSLYDKDTELDYADGEYELKIDYTTLDGIHHVKSYTLVIESKVPEITTTEINTGSTRVHIEDTNVSRVSVNGTKEYTPISEEGGYYVDIPHADFPDGKVVIKVYDSVGNMTNCMTNLKDEDHFMFISSELNSTLTYTITKKADGDHGILVTTAFKKANKKYTLNQSTQIKFKLFEGIDYTDLTITDYTGTTKKQQVTFEYDNGYIIFTSKLGKFILTSASIDNTVSSSSSIVSSSEVISSSEIVSSSEVASSSEILSSSEVVNSSSEITSSDNGGSSNPETPSKGCVGSVAGTSLMLATVALLSLIKFSKKKED